MLSHEQYHSRTQALPDETLCICRGQRGDCAGLLQGLRSLPAGCQQCRIPEVGPALLLHLADLHMLCGKVGAPIWVSVALAMAGWHSHAVREAWHHCRGLSGTWPGLAWFGRPLKAAHLLSTAHRLSNVPSQCRDAAALGSCGKLILSQPAMPLPWHDCMTLIAGEAARLRLLPPRAAS